MNEEKLTSLYALCKPYLEEEPEKPKEKIESSPIWSGFEEINLFFEKNGRPPIKKPNADIFERCLAIHLDVIKKKYKDEVKSMDVYGLLEKDKYEQEPKDLDADSLAKLMGLDKKNKEAGSITHLKFVQSAEQRKQASPEHVASREPCKDFEKYKGLFEKVKKDLASGKRRYFFLTSYKDKRNIVKGNFYVIRGQMLYIKDIGEFFNSRSNNVKENEDALVEVVYDNGTYSRPLLSSIINSMYADKTSRGITTPQKKLLHSHDSPPGTIYILRSNSSNPIIKQHRLVIHKIGFTTGETSKRVSNAKNELTYLYSDVEVVAEYQVKEKNARELETLLHRIFSSVRLKWVLQGDYGKDINPKEWFYVPLEKIDEAIKYIEKGEAEGLYYNKETESLEKSIKDNKL